MTTLRTPVPLVKPWTDGATWDDFVARAPDGTVAHRWAWMQIVPAAYGHQAIPLAAVRDGALVGVLPLVLLRSRLFGRHLVSMPFLDYGGLCTAGDHLVERALVAAAVDLARSNRAKLELRHLSDRSVDLPASLHKVTMMLDLSGGEDAVWRRIRSNRRGQVRKAQRNGLVASVHGAGRSKTSIASSRRTCAISGPRFTTGGTSTRSSPNSARTPASSLSVTGGRPLAREWC